MGCVVTWVHRSMSAWVAWVKFSRGLHGLRGSKYFLRGSTFYADHNFYVGCVSQIYFSLLQNFCVGKTFLRGSTFIYKMILFYCTTSNRLGNFFAGPWISLVFLSSLVPKADLGPLQRFRWSDGFGHIY